MRGGKISLPWGQHRSRRERQNSPGRGARGGEHRPKVLLREKEGAQPWRGVGQKKVRLKTLKNEEKKIMAHGGNRSDWGRTRIKLHGNHGGDVGFPTRKAGPKKRRKC